MKTICTSIRYYFFLLINAYRRWWIKADAEWRAKNKQQQEAAFIMRANNLYFWFSDFILEAIWNCADAVHFCSVSDTAQIFHRNWLQQDKLKHWILVYRCRYHAGYGVSRDDFQTAIQTELTEACALSGISLIPVMVKPSKEHIAYIAVPLKSIMRAYNEREANFYV